MNRFFPSFFIILAIMLSGHSVASDTRTLSVALTGKYPPFSFYDSQGDLAGYDVDISRAVAKELGLDLEIVTTEWDGILAGLLAGKYDVIIGSMAITQERKKQVLFSDPYYLSGAQLFIDTAYIDEIDSITGCSGRKLGVVLGETYEHYLRNNHPDVDVVTYKSTVDILQDIENQRLVGLVTDKLVGAWQIKQAGKPLVPAGGLLYEERIAIPVNKSNKALLEKINAALADIERSGQKDRLFEKWFGLKQTGRIESGMTRSTIVEKLGRGFAVTLGVAFISILLGFLLSIPCGVILNMNTGFAYRSMRFLVDFIRGTPVLIQLFFVYFGAPQVGLTLSPIASAVITLTINTAAYMAEVIRSGLMSVNPGQKLAGRALGLTRFQIFQLIIWPQAFRIAIPPLMNSVVALTKDTALISIISVSEVVREAQSIISVTFNPITFYFIVAVMFFIVTFPLMKLAGRLEYSLKQRGYAHD